MPFFLCPKMDGHLEEIKADGGYQGEIQARGQGEIQAGEQEEFKVGNQEELKANGGNGERRIERIHSTYAIPEGVTPPPLIGNQRFVLYNIAHEEQAPSCAKPAIRLMGVFESEEEARSVLPPSSDVSYFVSPTHKFIPLLSKADRDPDVAVGTIVGLHENLIAANKADFDEMVDSQRAGVAGKSAATLRKQSQRTRAPRELKAEVIKPCAPTTGAQCLAGQSVAVVAILHDIRAASLSGEAPLEPLIAVLHATGTEEQATAYAKYTASKQYPNNDFFVVDMYKWLFPEDVDLNNLAKEEFSNEKIDAIFKKRRADADKIAELEVTHPGCFIDINGEPRELPSASSCVFTHEPLPPEVVDGSAGGLEESAHGEPDPTLQLIEDIAVDLQRLN